MESQAAELKIQGRLEAARNRKSKVTAEDAEKKMIEETRKAGAQAYLFNPNASPEEKAAQARSAIPPGFHHEKKPTAMGVVTDLDDGTGNIYNLPPPDKGGALAVTFERMPNGEIKAEDDNDRWEQTGWAPQFGFGITKDTDGETALDHQTWLEGRLDDKYFGDWYHNTGVIVFACLSSWLVATLGGGLGWIMIILACCGTYYRTSIRRVRRNFRDDVERDMAKARLETDVESLEWINSFLVKFWPIYEPVLAGTVIKSVDQVLSTSKPAFLENLRLRSFTLGTKPPRLDHVKTYPKVEDDIVLMDWKFSFTPNDVADLTARQIKNKINPKIILEVRIGKAMVSTGLDVIVEDMAFSGLMRVKVKLQIPFPHVDRIEVCFLEQPTIDYVCKPVGGETLGFDINFIPGLESFIQSQIHANLGPMFYAPNVFPVEVAKMLSGDPVDQAVGVVAVTLHGAQGLKNPDKFSGTPDPYVVISLNRKDTLAKTKTIKENANPRWNETHYIIVTSLYDTLSLQVYDFNEFRKDRELGIASFALEQLQTAPEHENLHLEVSANGKARGMLQADVRFFPVLEGSKSEDGTVEPPPESNAGIARFTVEEAKDLDGTKSLIGKLNPYAVLLLNGKEVHVTQKLKRTNSPVFPSGHKELLITDRNSAKLGLVIKDDRDLATDPELGAYQIKLDDLLRMMEKGQEWYHLAGAKTGRVKLRLQWKPVALKGVAGASDGYVKPIGVMRLHFQGARELRNVETIRKSDPYVRVLLSGIEKARTVTFQNNLDPEWDEVHYIPMHSTRERVLLEVMDEENLGKDRSLGQTELSAADYIRQDESGEYVEHNERRLHSDPLRVHGKGSPIGTLNYTVAFYPCLEVADPEEEGGNVKERKSEDEQFHDAEDETKQEGVNGDSTILQSMEQQQPTKNKKLPKIHLTADDLGKYESGLIIFKLIEGEFSRSNCRVEVLMDDMRYPSYISSKTKSKSIKFDETGDTFVRELDVSRITVRLRKTDNRDDDDDDNVVAKLTGETLTTLKRCFNNPTVLTMQDSDGGINKIKATLKYLPVKMRLDPSESINNMGNLRVDVIEAAGLPAADRNGYSDPYCKFMLNGKEVYKTAVQPKTLSPTWKENFETPIRSRTGAKFKVVVYDRDAIGNDDLLGEADIDLEPLEPHVAKEYKLRLSGETGAIRLRLLFRPDYLTRSRLGSSTFSGGFGAPQKIVTGVAGAPIKGVTMVGGGVAKGASFLKQGFRGKNKGETVISEETANIDTSPAPNKAMAANGEPSESLHVPKTPTTGTPHIRSSSFGGRSMQSASGGRATGGPELGTAQFSILGATGYAKNANVRVHVKQLTSKGTKEVHKTKAVNASSGEVQWDNETFRVHCTPDAQFQIVIKDHAMFHNSELGEALFFIDDSTAGSEQSVKAGTGTVVLRTSFAPFSGASPDATGAGAGAGSGGGVKESSPRNSTIRKSFMQRNSRERRTSGA
ncbi:MAG: hypothetical protein M1816_001040 [Peltula sp. TS41687]|nr:MAG: hypothetical protein M1816_001040 [Peltula sp. TS41687]